MYPLKMQPAFKDYLWGGTRLKTRYHKPTDLDIVAESWEISCHPDGPSRVSNGEYSGRLLPELLAAHPRWLGSDPAGEFPLLVKLIDAKQALSLQVHPNNEYARRVENQLGKNEMWYVMDAEPGAELILGFQRAVSPEELRRRITDNTILDVVRRVPVKAGDCFLIPAGMLHAIGGGLLIAEIQQSSNVTYRVYDYDRRDADGNPRPLHIDKALDVIDSTLQAVNTADSAQQKKPGYSSVELADWEYFNSLCISVESEAALSCSGDSFQCIVAVSGDLQLRHRDQAIPLVEGDSLFLPAGLGDYTLTGAGKVLLTAVR